MVQIHDLEPIFTKKVTDFYGMDKIVSLPNGTKILTDAKRPIMKIVNNKPKLMVRHLNEWEIVAVREFLIQHNHNCPTRFTEVRQMY